jgi:hypothetical protein
MGLLIRFSTEMTILRQIGNRFRRVPDLGDMNIFRDFENYRYLHQMTPFGFYEKQNKESAGESYNDLSEDAKVSVRQERTLAVQNEIEIFISKYKNNSKTISCNGKFSEIKEFVNNFDCILNKEMN